MSLRKALQGFERRGRKEENAVGVVARSIEGLRYDEVAHATLVEVADIVVTIARSRFQGEEERGFREGERAAVGKEPFYLVGFAMCANHARVHHRGYCIYFE